MGIKETVFGSAPFTKLMGEKYPEPPPAEAGTYFEDTFAAEAVLSHQRREWWLNFRPLAGLKYFIDEVRREAPPSEGRTRAMDVIGPEKE